MSKINLSKAVIPRYTGFVQAHVKHTCQIHTSTLIDSISSPSALPPYRQYIIEFTIFSILHVIVISRHFYIVHECDRGTDRKASPLNVLRQKRWNGKEQTTCKYS